MTLAAQARVGALERAVAAGAAVALALQIGGAAAKYATHVVFARWSDPEAFGLYAYGMAWAHVLAIVGSLGLATGVLRFLPAYMVSCEWSLARGLIAWTRITVLAAGTLAGIGYVGVELLTGRAPALWPMVVLAPFTAIAFVQAELLRAMRQVTAAYAPTLILQALLAVAFAAIWLAAFRSFNGREALWIQAGAAAAVVAVQCFLMRALAPSQLRRQPPRYEVRRWLTASLPLLAISGFVIVLGQVDVIMVGLLGGAVEAGTYSAASRTAGLVGLALMAANAVVAPMISEFYESGRRDELQRAVSTGTRLALAGSLAAALGLAAFGKDVLSLFGADYAEGYTVVMALAAAHVVSAGAGPVGYLMSLTGHEKSAARVYALCTLGNVALSALLIPLWGQVGAAAATAATMVAWNVWLRLLVSRRLGLRSQLAWRLAEQ